MCDLSGEFLLMATSPQPASVLYCGLAPAPSVKMFIVLSVFMGGFGLRRLLMGIPCCQRAVPGSIHASINCCTLLCLLAVAYILLRWVLML